MLIVLKSDLWGEDGQYTLCTIEVPDKTKIPALDKKLTKIIDKVRKDLDGAYETDDFINAIEEAGYTIVNDPVELIVLQ